MDDSKTILLVEDEVLIAMEGKRLLQSEGYRVLCVYDGESAIQLVCTKEETVDLILMDVDLGSGMDGTEAARIILQSRDIPIVFLSGHTEKEVVEKTEAITSYGYVVKNSNPTVLFASIKMAFRLHEAHTRLRQSENRYRRLIDGAPDIVYTFSVKQGAVYYSPRIEHILGYTVEYLYAHPFLWNESIHPDDLPSARRGSQAVREGLPFDIEYRVRDAQGAWHWIRDRSIGRYTIGDELFIEGLATDITARKNTEAALQTSEAAFRSIFEKTSVGTLLTGPDGRLLNINAALAQMLGYSIEEMQGHYFREFTHPEDMEISFEQLRRLLAGEEDSAEFVKRYLRKDGSTLWAHVNTTLVRDTQKAALYFITSIVDITARRQAELDLASHKTKLENILTGTNSGTWEWNVQTGEAIFNERWAEIIGYTLAEISPVSIATWVKFTHPEDLEKSDGLLARHFNGQLDYYECEARMRHKNGEWVWVLDRGKVASWTADGKPLMMFGTHQDITERKRNEEQIQTLLEEKELLMREIHHRVKNNLLMISSLLKIQAENEKYASAQAVLHDAASRVQSIILLYDRLYRSHDLQAVSLQEYIPSLLNEIMILFPGKNAVKIKTSIDPVTLDPKKAVQVGMILNELTTNALKHAFPAGRDAQISITVLQKNGQVCLTFADDGIGLPEEFTIDQSTGFGIQLVGIFARQLKGSIHIERDQGTRFIFEFQK